MVRILITGAHSSLNNGNMAMVLATITTLKEMMPDVEITLVSETPHIDRVRYRNNGIKIIGVPWHLKYPSRTLTLMASFLKSLFMLFVHFLAFLKLPIKSIWCSFLTYDLVIELGGDTLSEYYGLVSLYDNAYPLFLSFLLKKPFVIYAQSVGPFNSRLIRFFIRFLFNKASLITLRERISEEYLSRVGVDNKNIFLTADAAFLLNPVYPSDFSRILREIVSRENLEGVIGLSASQLIYRYAFSDIYDLNEKRKTYINFIVDLINYILKNYKVMLVLIPHVMTPKEDDRIIHEEIFSKLDKEEQRKVLSIQKAYRADEIKGIIGLCDIFIGCRMHSTIAALSMAVPTIALSYSHKFQGVIGELLGKQQVIDLRASNWKKILHRTNVTFDHTWNNRKKIAEELKEKTKAIEKRAIQNVKLVKKLLCYVKYSP